MGVVSFKGSLLLMAFLIHTVLTAPVIEENTELLGPDQIAEGKGCYYNYEHYDEGDRILTNEPCLNCTCHNRMLMCYLRVCPFTKAIGQDCKVEKKPDQCCPVITCPQVPVALLTSSTTETTASTTTAVGHPDSYGCVLDDNVFYADGAQVPSDPRKPCELCYCIRNQTACVMQECTLNVEGCKPVYQEGVCCPVRYDCDYDEVLTTPRPTAGLITTPGGPNECKANNDQIYHDGEMINNMTTNPCEHCYCMRGDVVCAVQECGTPLENTECTPMPAEPGQCCPSTYQCPNGTVPAHVLQATPNHKPSPPVVPSLAHIKPDTETEKPTVDDKIFEDNETAHDGQESENAGVQQQETEKIVGPPDSTVAESSEVITEAPKDVAIIEIITTAAPQNEAETQTQGSTNEALQTDIEQHPEEQQEISSVPEIIPEHDQVEEGHVEEEHVQEGHLEEGQGNDVEATTAPGHYTEISVENVEMNTSPPEKAKPEIPSASHSLGENESETMNTEAPQDLTTVGPSSPLVEQLPQNENQLVNNHQLEQDGSVQPESQDAISQPEHQDEISQPDHQVEISQPEHQDAISQPEHHDEISQPEHQVEISQPEHQDEISQPEHQVEISQPEHQDEISQSEHQEAASQGVNQQTTIQPDVQGSSIQPEIQEITIRPAIQEVINQLDNQGASSQQDNLEALHPETQDSSIQQVNQESSSQQEIVASPTELPPSSQQGNEESSSQKEIVASPTESAPSSQMPQEPLPEENEKLSAAHDLPETTPVSTTTTTEAEPIEMARIPGEGSCLHKGITYAPNTEVPSENPCKRCKCINSIVECKDPECPEPPITLYSNCVPMPPTDDACCPTYFCEQNPSQEPEVDSMSIDKIDQEVEEGAPEEGIAPTTVTSVHEDVPVVPEQFVPGTHEISDYTNHNVEDGAQPELPISEDAEESKLSGEGSQPESAVPSGEGSEQQSPIPSEGSQPESAVPSGEGSEQQSPILSEGSQPESAVPSGEGSGQQSPIPSEGSQPESAVPSGEGSEQQSPILSEGSQPESAVPSGEGSEQQSPILSEGSQPESAVPSGEGSEQQSPIPSEGSQPESDVPSGEGSEQQSPILSEGSQPESAVPSGEGSEQQSSIPSEVSHPESAVPSGEGSEQQSLVPSDGSQPESAAPSEVSQPESVPVESGTESQAPEVSSVDITTALPEVPSDHPGPSSDQHEESPDVAIEDVHPVSEDNVESESAHDVEGTPTTAPTDVIPEEQGGKLEEAQNYSEVSQTTAVDEQQIVTESPQQPAVEQVSFDGSEDAQPLPEHSLPEVAAEVSTAQPELEKPQEIPGSQDSLPINEETIETTVAPTHGDNANVENGQEMETQHGDLTNQEGSNVEGGLHGQESTTEVESSVSSAVSTDAPNIPIGEHEDAEHDSVPSGSSQPIEAEVVPTIDQSENDLTATHDQSAPESPTTAIPEEVSSVHAELHEAQLPSTEGPSGASENPETPEPMVTAGPPVLFPDISHQGAPIHIPGPTGINTDGLTSEDERLGETEAPIQEPSQTEQPQTSEESSSSGDVQQASEGEINGDVVYTTEGLNTGISHQTEEAANEVASGIASEDNQITESSQTSEPSEHHDANESLSPEHEPILSGDRHIEEVKEPAGAQPSTEVIQSVTETSQDQVQNQDETEVHSTHVGEEVQPTHDESEIQPTHDESEIQPTHDDTEVPTAHDDTEVSPAHDDTVAQPTHDESGAQQTLDGSEAQQTHDESEAQPTLEGTPDQTETHEKPADQQGVTEASTPELGLTETEAIATEAPQGPIVTHGDLPTPSEPSTNNAILPHSETEAEKQPEPSQTQQPQDTEVSASQPAAENQEHEKVESDSEHTQEVTRAPENDEVVTHIDSAGPQQVPEIANQVVETETNAIEHATGLEHGAEPSASSGDQTTGTDEVAHVADHQEPIEQEQPPQPEEPQSITEEPQNIPEEPQSIPEEPQSIPEEHHSDAVPAEHEKLPDVVAAVHQEHPESDQVPILEDHSEGHNGPNLGENQEQQTEQPASEGQSEQTQSEPQQPEMVQTELAQSESSTQLPEHTNAGEAQFEPQEETVHTLPEATHDENQPEQPLVDEHLEQEEPQPEQTHIENAEVSHSDIAEQEQPQTTPVSELVGSPQESTVTPEQQNVISGQPVEIAMPAVSEHQEPEVSGDVQETATEEEHGSGLPTTDEQVSLVEENQEHIPVVSHDSAPAATGEEGAHTAAPSVGETVHTEEVTVAPEQPDDAGENHKPTVEAEKDGDHATETTPAVHGQDQQQTHEELVTPEGQPNELIAPSPESEPSGSDLPTPAAEEVPVESAPSSPSAPESASSASESVAPEEPSAPESIVPEQPSAPELVVPEQPSAPESVVPEQPSAPELVVPEQPSAPESVVPEQPSAPELVVPEQPSAPELVVPEQPSAPEYTAPEQPSGPESEVLPSAPESEVQPSAPEQPVAPETQQSSVGQDEVLASQESDIQSQPDQSSHLVGEIEKEQSVPETSSSSPIAELAPSSPLPPVEIPSTEGPVLPPGLQTWSQKPYHPPSLPEHQQHHQTAEVPHLPEDSHYPSQPYDQDYEDDDNVSYGPGTCRYGGKVYLSAQQIPRDDPCDFCFCFRSDIICLQQSCPPPIRGCYQETIKGFCCPRYECHVSMATMVNITTTSTTTTTTVPPHFLSHHYNGSAMKAGCQVKGIAYRVGDRIPSTSGPCLDCRCGADGQMKCDPTVCGPQESLLRQVMAASVSKRRRR